jgi:molecular chaperone DnaK
MHLGIDLGTTYTLTSHLNAQGVPALVPDPHFPSEFRTASVVQLDGSTALVGRAAEEALLEDATLPTARGFKAQMGALQAAWRDPSGRLWSAEALSALVLRKQLRDQDLHLGEAVESVVITVPANFNDQQRRATRLAARLAGLGNVHLVEEPIAAAMFYGYSERGAEQTLLVYDFGGGTFDATVLHIAAGRIYVLANQGHNQLGGRRIDQRIAELIAEEVRRVHRVDLGTDPATAEPLRRAAEDAKLTLSGGQRSLFRRTLVVGGRTLEFMLGRDQLDRLVLPLVEESLVVAQRCLDDASLHWGLIDRVLLTGGSSLLPQVSRRLGEVSGKRGDALLCRHPHQAVAYGAALIADARAGGSGAEPTIAVAPAHLGLRVRDPATGRDRLEVLVKRNTPLPARQTATFYTVRPDQTRMILDVAQSRGDGEPVESLGTIAFGPLRRPQQNYPVEITLGYDSEGIVRVTARDPLSGEALEREFAGGADPELQRLAQEKAQVMAIRIGP